ncbi:MAG: metallophosphoesterase [Planctomycetota bacterium]|jgi:hypothetical protein
MKRRDFLKKISVGTAAFAMGTPDFALLADNGLTGIFGGTIVLGRPTDSSITINVLSNDQLEAYFEYGTQSGVYTDQTTTSAIEAGVPFEEVIANLQPNTRYYYRMRFRGPGGGEFKEGLEYTLHTQRQPSSIFAFTVQSDSHLGDSGTNTALYEITLRNAVADDPDFHIDLGDTFMTEKITSGSYEDALQVALNHRPYFDIIARSAALFLANGNHEGELGWKLDGTGDNVAINSTDARQFLYPTPSPGGFYSGSSTPELYIGIRDAYYAWMWGDALFVVLDPFWYTTVKAKQSGDCWDWTLGYEQYSWLKDTLERSNTTFKFVFIHNLFGELVGRGGIETAGYYEWGGDNADGTWGFDTRRSGWAMPIHDLLVANNVSVVFHGHDHLFIKQDLDGIVYQLVPRPSHRNYDNIKNAEKFGYINGDVIGNSGHLRVTVSDSEVEVDYVRAYLPEDEDANHKNGEVAYTYTITGQ